MNKHDKYLDLWPFRSKIIIRTHQQTDRVLYQDH